jgi:glutathione S-transferase
MTLKLSYFPAPGSAEPARLAFTLGDIPFEDVLVTKATYMEHKAKSPNGFPYLEFPDGKISAQSGTIARYAARLAGLLPSDPKEAMDADQAFEIVKSDLVPKIYATMALDAEAKLAARKNLVENTFPSLLKQYDDLLGSFGDNLTLGHLPAVGLVQWVRSGALDGIPTTLFDAYPNIVAAHDKLVAEPKVQAYYASRKAAFEAAKSN